MQRVDTAYSAQCATDSAIQLELYSAGVEYNAYPHWINAPSSCAAFQPHHIADHITDTDIQAAFDAPPAGEFNPGWMADNNIGKILIDVMESTPSLMNFIYKCHFQFDHPVQIRYCEADLKGYKKKRSYTNRTFSSTIQSRCGIVRPI